MIRRGINERNFEEWKRFFINNGYDTETAKIKAKLVCFKEKIFKNRERIIKLEKKIIKLEKK